MGITFEDLIYVKEQAPWILVESIVFVLNAMGDPTALWIENSLKGKCALYPLAWAVYRLDQGNDASQGAQCLMLCRWRGGITPMGRALDAEQRAEASFIPCTALAKGCTKRSHCSSMAFPL